MAAAHLATQAEGDRKQAVSALLEDWQVTQEPEIRVAMARVIAKGMTHAVP